MTDLADAQRFLTSTAISGVLRGILDIPRTIEFDFEVERLHSRPGIDISIVYRVHLAGATRYAAITTANVPGRRFHSPIGPIHGWEHPYDPVLTGLPSACDRHSVATWLGVDTVSLEVVSYRPLRRAVLRARHRETTWYLKVLPRARAGALVQRLQLLDGIGPHLIGTPAPDTVLTSAVGGHSLAESYVAWHSDPTALPSPGNLGELLDRLPPGVMRLPARRAWCDRVDFYAAGARVALPERAAEIDRLEARLTSVLADSDRGPLVPGHGDFYEANIFVRDAVATSLIDVDAVGPGYRVDDYACLLGHLAVLPDLSPRHYPRLATLLPAWTAAFARDVDPVALRARVAGVILSLIVGAQPGRAAVRLDLAERWLADAERLANIVPAPFRSPIG